MYCADQKIKMFMGCQRCESFGGIMISKSMYVGKVKSGNVNTTTLFFFHERTWNFTSRKKRTSENNSNGTLQWHPLSQVRTYKQAKYQSIMQRCSWRVLWRIKKYIYFMIQMQLVTMYVDNIKLPNQPIFHMNRWH